CGSGSDDAKMFGIEPAELSGNYIGQARAQVVLLGITAKIDKREDNESNFLGNRRLKPTVQPKRQGTENSESEEGGDDALPYRSSLERIRTRGGRRFDVRLNDVDGRIRIAQFLFAGESVVGCGVILWLTVLDPLIEFSRVGVDGGFFLVFVAMDGEAF